MGKASRFYSDGNMTLSGQVADQAALYGLLTKVGDLGLALISVNPLGPSPQDPGTNWL